MGIWIGALLLAALLAGCGDGAPKEEAVEIPPESQGVYYPGVATCNLGRGSDYLIFNGTTYTQNGSCTTDVLAYYDASQNAIAVSAVNNLFGLGHGSSLVFGFEWQATGTTGLFLAPPDLLFLQEGGTISLCFFGIGAINVTRRDGPGGLITGDFAFSNLSLPWLCSVTSITGSFSISREADVVTGTGTQASPVMLTPGAGLVDGTIAGFGISNYGFVATASSHTVSLVNTHSDLRWAAYSHKPNIGDSAVRLCDDNPGVADEVCTLTGLNPGSTYYVQVGEFDDVAGRYRIGVN